jgi:hypothetical protein
MMGGMTGSMGGVTAGKGGAAPAGGSGGSIGTGGNAGGSGGAPTPDAGMPDVPPAGPDLTTGLVAHYRFDESGAREVALDSSGFANHANLYRGDAQNSWGAGKTGSAFVGGQGVVLAPASSSLDSVLTAVTIAAWIHRDATTSGFEAIASRQIGMSSDEHYYLGFINGNLAFFGTVVGRLETDRKVTQQAGWTHVAGTYDGERLRLFVNAVQVKDLAASNKRFAADNSPLAIGANVNGQSLSVEESFRGRIDQLRVYRRALPIEALRELAK